MKIEHIRATELSRRGLRQMLTKAQEGERMIITWNGKPMAMLGPIVGQPVDPTSEIQREMFDKTTQNQTVS